MFIPDQNFFHPGSRIRIKEFKYFIPIHLFLSSRKYDPGCSSRIRILIFYPSRIPDPGVKKAPNTVSRIRNTGLQTKKREITATAQAKRKLITIHQESKKKETFGLEVMSGLFLGGLTVSALNHPRSSLSSLIQVSSFQQDQIAEKIAQKIFFVVLPTCNMLWI
jgi:hypothetical protein